MWVIPHEWLFTLMVLQCPVSAAWVAGYLCVLIEGQRKFLLCFYSYFGSSALSCQTKLDFVRFVFPTSSLLILSPPF